MRQPRSHPFAPSAGRAFAPRSAYNSARTTQLHSFLSRSSRHAAQRRRQTHLAGAGRGDMLSALRSLLERNTPYKSARCAVHNPATNEQQPFQKRRCVSPPKRSLCQSVPLPTHTPPSLSRSASSTPASPSKWRAPRAWPRLRSSRYCSRLPWPPPRVSWFFSMCFWGSGDGLPSRTHKTKKQAVRTAHTQTNATLPAILNRSVRRKRQNARRLTHTHQHHQR